MKQFLVIAALCAYTAGLLVSCNETPETPEQPAKTKYVLTLASDPNSYGNAVTATVGGNAVTNGAQVEEGATVSVTATAGTGFVFENWSSPDAIVFDNAQMAAATFTMPSKAAQVVANFTAASGDTFAVNFNAAPAGGTVVVKVDGTAISSGDQVASGTSVSVTATPAADYFMFDGWSGAIFADPTAAETTFTMPENDVNLIAAFVPLYLINYSNPAGGTISVKVGQDAYTSGTPLRENTVVTITATPNPGFSFGGWIGLPASVTDTGASFSFPITDDINLYATFTANKYAITFDAPENGNAIEVKVDGNTIDSGTEVNADAIVSVKAIPDATQIFTTWGSEGGKIASFIPNATSTEATFIMPAQAVKLTAAFDVKPADKYTVTITAPTNGTISVKNGDTVINNGDQVEAAGTSLTIVAAANPGYYFAGWTFTGFTDGLAANVHMPSRTLAMPEDNVSIAADFVQITDFVTIGGVKWATKNIAAAGSFATNIGDYGQYFQYAYNTSWAISINSSNMILACTPTPDGAEFMTESNGWKDAGTAIDYVANPWAQGPCPTGYKVPTKAQWDALVAATTAKVAGANSLAGVMLTATADGAKLFMPFTGSILAPSTAPAPGFMWNTMAGATRPKVTAAYWTADGVAWDGSAAQADANYISFTGGTANSPTTGARRSLMPVRCVGE